jgi:hypothetical protein
VSPVKKPDLSEFYRLSNGARRKPCSIAFVLDQITPEESEQLIAALAVTKEIITASAISQWLDARGLVVSIPAISTHRQRRCVCYAK